MARPDPYARNGDPSKRDILRWLRLAAVQLLLTNSAHRERQLRSPSRWKRGASVGCYCGVANRNVPHTDAGRSLLDHDVRAFPRDDERDGRDGAESGIPESLDGTHTHTMERRTVLSDLLVGI